MDKPHKKLDVWRTSMDAAQEVYRLTGSFPAEEKFGLVAQMRRAAVAIPSDIAEGAARQGKAEFRNFLSMAQGSLSELDTQLELSVRLCFVADNDVRVLSDYLLRIDKMLTALIRTLTKKREA